MKKLLLTLSMMLGLNTSALMAELTQAELDATLGIVTNLILDDGITHNGTSYGTVTSPYTGRVWLDRNLGASQACTSFDDALCYGDYYQWGRNYDGHEDNGSATTVTQATDVTSVGHGEFIMAGGIDGFDWAQAVDGAGTDRTANWSKTDGSSVCPVGFRVPNTTELRVETVDEDVTNRDTAFTNFLKLPSAGLRSRISGTTILLGSWGYVLTSTATGDFSNYVLFGSGTSSWTSGQRANGLSVRCIKN